MESNNNNFKVRHVAIIKKKNIDEIRTNIKKNILLLNKQRFQNYSRDYMTIFVKDKEKIQTRELISNYNI